MNFDIDITTATFEQIKEWFKQNKELIPDDLILHGEHVIWQQPRLRFSVDIRWIDYELKQSPDPKNNANAKQRKNNLVMLYKDLKHYHENQDLLTVISVQLKEVIIFDPNKQL